LNHSTIRTASPSVDAETWTPMSAADSVFDRPLESVTETLTFAQLGTYSICVRGADASSNTSVEACTTVTVTAPNALHVGAINGTVTPGKKTYILAVTVQVFDVNNPTIQGVGVSTRITPVQHPDAVRAITARTNKSGVAKFSVTSKTDTAWEICVTNLTKSGYTYDETVNVETCETFGLTL
jgi:hypothetical protein